MVILSHYFNTGVFNLMFHMINKPALLVEVWCTLISLNFYLFQNNFGSLSGSKWILFHLKRFLLEAQGVASRTHRANLSSDILVTLPNQGLLRSDYSEMWLDIQGFINFTAGHFVAKFHTVNSSQNSHLCRLYSPFNHYPKFMTTGENRKKDRFKMWQICGVWKLPWPQSDKAHAELRLLYKSVCQHPCSAFLHS